ncbi:MFS transporter [Sporolactobacillus terrae]|uniref:MFS transporter n=1 Tax=Sporolactobacillus terrae TaxID=269673 RepID=UPI0012612D5E|nr:MFS transporter [Sporolactobacillus terrae]UAK15814.1 MFS transporter [Sporolactobacillus terrae]
MTKKYSFRFLWIGQSLANCGDVFYIVGLMTVVYVVTKSAILMTVIPFLTTVIRFISGILAPLILNKLGLKGTLVSSQIGKTLFLFFMALTLTLHLFGPNFLVVFFFVACISFLDGWASPARNAMVPMLIDRDRLVNANGFLSILDQSINLSGWALGGMLAALIGGANIVWTTFFLFIISSIFMFMIKIDTSINNSRKNNSSVGHFEVMREGWHAIWHKPVLRIISITDMIGTIASVVWMAAIVLVFVHQALRVNESWWGFINFSFFAGLIVGGLISIRLSDHINKHLKVVSLVGLFMTGIATMLFGWNTFPLLALIFSAVVGIFDQLRNVTFETLIQTNTKSDLLAQVYSAQDAMYSLSYGIATLVFGYLTDKIGVQLVFTLSSGLLFISFIYVMGSKNYLVKPEDVRADE